jgi:S-adenosylmethionine/arginine decarboxylase-like enzyme
MVLLDESHCSAHAYSDEGLLALDIFTCGNTDPRDVLAYMQEMLDLGDITVQHCERFHTPGERFRAPEIAVSLKSFRTEAFELAASGNGHE